MNYCVTVSAPGYPTYTYGGFLQQVTYLTLQDFVQGIRNYYRASLGIPGSIYVAATIPVTY
ncbi:hypothetical protein KIK84_04765 [Curvibacter sp. CHRR-16]|uniref:hypothetical protein n=1 Tax=Curvibacter sp. CHRR-16 TaxID=2835872 RepID=UPI001BD9EBF7|nr:hypothetical protein [Curvibacter sp. CHRR-16]MBT0569625.1 hypothetical protein [Curvibacter sp. CHRR-16]